MPPARIKMVKGAKQSAHFPADIYMMFAQFLDFHSIARLDRVCRSAHSGMMRHKGLKLGTLMLSPEQGRIRAAIASMPNAEPGDPLANAFVLRAPMGFGKTVCGMSVAYADLKDGHRYLIMVPPRRSTRGLPRQSRCSAAPSALSLLTRT